MSVRYRRLEGSNNEPVMGRGRQDFIMDVDAVSQAVITRLRLWRGEWWENEKLGIPMWQSILGTVGAKREMIDRIIQSTVSETKGVRSIQSIDSIFNTESRRYQFVCVINTVYGRINITNG